MINNTSPLLKDVLSNGIFKSNTSLIPTLIDNELTVICQQTNSNIVFVITNQRDNMFFSDFNSDGQGTFCLFLTEPSRNVFCNDILGDNNLIDALWKNKEEINFLYSDIDKYSHVTSSQKVILLQLSNYITPLVKWESIDVISPVEVGDVKVTLVSISFCQPSINHLKKRYIDETKQKYLENITFQIAAAMELKRIYNFTDKKEKQYQELFQQLPIACGFIDINNFVVMKNKAAEKCQVFTIGKNLFHHIHVDDHNLLLNTIKSVRKGIMGQAFCNVSLTIESKKRWFKFSFCNALNVQNQLFLLFEEITENYLLTDRLCFDSNHDYLTGLPNRLHFENTLMRALEDNQSGNICVAFLDLDQFQVVNSLSGHQTGDQLLQKIAKLLKKLVRQEDVVARLSGDEFGLLMYNTNEQSAKDIAKNICNSLILHEFSWGGLEHNVSASIGIAKVEPNATDIYQVMSQADAACRLAKEEGRNRWHFFSSKAPQEHALYNQMIASVDITKALSSNRFELFYQVIEPLVKEQSGLHIEVLLRMIKEENIYVYPSIFFPAAERYNLASQLDQWVIDNLLNWGHEYFDIWNKLSMVSINLSAKSLCDQVFMNWLGLRLISEPKLVNKLCFEITETAAISQLQQVTALIDLLKPLGCKLALDDFGSGFSSFTYLKNLDFDFVKIDGKFIVNVCSDKGDEAIVNATCLLSKEMNFEIVAEFVESVEIGHKLRHLGVHYGQGYAINKPSSLKSLVSGVRDEKWLL